MFGDYLQITLSLTINGTAHAIPGANVKTLELDLASYGFAGAVEFVVTDDANYGGKETDSLLADFQTAYLIEVAVSIDAALPNPEESSAISAVSVTGLATRRCLEEISTMEHQDRAILWRRYRVEFADPARVLWGQHHPAVLYTEKSMTDVIDDHKGSKITMSYDGDSFSTALPLVFLHLVPRESASFYDFVVWFADMNARVFCYDYTSPGYWLREAKDSSGTASELFGDDLRKVRVVFPEVPRYASNVLNSYATAKTTTAIANTYARDSIRHDFLMRSPIATNADDRVTRETSRLVTRLSQLEVEFARWPSITFQPGALIDFTAANLWATNALHIGTTWRVVRHEIRARAQDMGNDADHNFTKAMYNTDVRAVLEQKDETWVELPAYTRPKWPALVEGTVVSEQGEDDELTYEYSTDSDTSLNEYKVKIPLFTDQIVTAPYEPHQGSGKMYVPIFKNERVLVAFGFLHASIVRLLDWRDGVMMAMDAQGERIFFGKKIGAATMVDHSYTDSNPVFLINRTNDVDTQTITISEGSLVIQVKETS